MKKTYVFLNRRICGVDGSIQYIYNKSQYLKTKGYDIIVFSVQPGKILVEDFKQYQPFILSEMQYCPSMYRRSESEKIIKHVMSQITGERCDEIIIESTSPVSAIWGELIAQELQCKHIFFYLFERTDIAQEVRDFCFFKYHRGELAGITKNTVSLLLNDGSVDPCKISAYCNNVFSDCKDVFSERLSLEASYTIGSIGRLEKPCVPIFTDELFNYFAANCHQSYNFVMIGGSGDGKEARRLRNKFRELNNVTFLITDYLYPIPLSLVDRIDLFVSTAGSASATYLLGKPTIKVHPISGETLGIVGCDFDLRDKSMYDVTGNITLESCMNRILLDDVDINYETAKLQSEEYEETMRREFDRQLYIAKTGSTIGYYDTYKLNKINTPFVRLRNILKIFCHVLGGANTLKFVNSIKEIEG